MNGSYKLYFVFRILGLLIPTSAVVFCFAVDTLPSDARYLPIKMKGYALDGDNCNCAAEPIRILF